MDVSECCNFQGHNVKGYLCKQEHQTVQKCYKSDFFLKWLRNAVLNNILQVHESLRPLNTKQTNSMCSFFWLFWFCCQYLQSDWLDSLWGSITMARGSSRESPGRRVYMIFLVYCIASLFNCILCLSCFPALHNIFHTTMPRCSLFVLKVA